MASANPELKPSDYGANSYLALGGLIAAGMDGIEQNLHPQEVLLVDVDPAALTAEERERRGIQPLPSSLSHATTALENDHLLVSTLGPALSSSYLAIRRADWQLFPAPDTDFALKQHFY